MPFIETVPEDAAEGATAEWYAADRAEDGYVSNSTKAFGHRPAVLAAWVQLGGTIGGSMDRRRYELATVAAARVLRSSYCSLAHGKVLAEQFLGPELTIALATGAVDPSTRWTPRSCGSRPWWPQSPPRSRPRTWSGCGPSGCPTRRSSTSSWPWPPAASSAPSSRPWASRPTRPSGRSTRSCATP